MLLAPRIWIMDIKIKVFVLGQRVAYIGISSVDQLSANQRADIQADQLFLDTVSGENIDRPELKRLIAYIRASDNVIVHSMDCLARNLDELRRLVYDLTKRGLKVEFLKEELVFQVMIRLWPSHYFCHWCLR